MDKDYKLSRNELATALEVSPQAITKAIKVGRLEGTYIANPAGQGYLFDLASAGNAFFELADFDGLTLQEIKLEQEKAKARILQLKLRDIVDRRDAEQNVANWLETEMPIG